MSECLLGLRQCLPAVSTQLTARAAYNAQKAKEQSKLACMPFVLTKPLFGSMLSRQYVYAKLIDLLWLSTSAVFAVLDVNADPAATSGAINVLSFHGLPLMIHGMVSVAECLLQSEP